jgi:integrase
VQVREQGFFPERTKGSGQTFADAMDSYLTRRESFWKAGPEWKRIGEKWKERFKGRRLREITRGDVQGEVSTFALNVKSGTVNRHLTLLKAFFRDAVDNGAIEKNSAQFVKKLRENNERVRYLTEAEEERLFTELPEKYRPVVLFAILTGMRRGEIFKLERRDVDLDRRIITVRDPKEGMTKRLPISQSVCALLVSAFKSSANDDPRPGDRVFPFDAHNFVNRVFIPTVRRAEIQDFRFHDLRHSFASRLAMKGVDLATIGKLMGHHGIRMTERYAHLTEDRLRAAVETLTDTPTDTEGDDERENQWAVQVSNLRPPACKADALPLS